MKEKGTMIICAPKRPFLRTLTVWTSVVAALGCALPAVAGAEIDWPPGTRISGNPDQWETSPQASFSFYSTEEDSTFECRVDNAAWTACASPRTYVAIGDGRHTFYVRAIDSIGQPDPTPSSYTWTVVTDTDTAPDDDETDATPGTRITANPAETSTSRSASFSFVSTETSSTFECRMDNAMWSTCASPRAYSSLTAGEHTFSVRAIDSIGQRDPTPSYFTWTIAASPGMTLLFDGFEQPNGANNVVTNEYDGWHASDSTAVNSPIWRSDGGSLFSVPAVDISGAAGRVGFTGKLDNGFADKYSQNYTHSNKMRFWTKPDGFDSIRIDADIKPLAWHASAPSSWAGFKFYMRRQADATKASFYTVEPYIQDGKVYIQKKCTGDTGGGNYTADGTYYLLASKSGFSVPLNSWQKVSATARTNSDGSVTLGLYRNGTLLIQAVDRGIRADGTGCAPLHGGHVGFRSDFFQYFIDNYRVSSL